MGFQKSGTIRIWILTFFKTPRIDFILDSSKSHFIRSMRRFFVRSCSQKKEKQTDVGAGKNHKWTTEILTISDYL